MGQQCSQKCCGEQNQPGGLAEQFPPVKRETEETADNDREIDMNTLMDMGNGSSTAMPSYFDRELGELNHLKSKLASQSGQHPPFEFKTGAVYTGQW